MGAVPALAAGHLVALRVGAVAELYARPVGGSRDRAVADQGHRGLDRAKRLLILEGSHHDGRYADGLGLRVRGARHA
jgi:hypothetical protein